MFRTSVCLAAILLISGTLVTASAQTADPLRTEDVEDETDRGTPEGDAREVESEQAKLRLPQRVRRRDLRRQRWFYIEDCMDRTETKPDVVRRTAISVCTASLRMYFA